jgi:hypothetical protein
MVQEAIASLGRDRVLGLVLNRALDPADAEGEKYAGYYRGSAAQRRLVDARPVPPR